MMSKLQQGCLAFLLVVATLTHEAQSQAQQQDPCTPSPCGVNTHCTVSSSSAGICRCLEGWDHAPGSNTIEGCPIRRSEQQQQHREIPSSSSGGGILNNRLGPGNIGVRQGCRAGSGCGGGGGSGVVEDRSDPCASPYPCGETQSASPLETGLCKPNHKGDPYTRCTSDPCSNNPCGVGAECINRNDRAECRCPSGFTGDPHTRCNDDPCNNDPSPCAQNANCESRGNQAICTCREGYEGDPFVRCTLNPCLTDPCGINAECSNRNGQANCVCKKGYEGDAHQRCNLNPCSDNPCGPNSKCEAQGNSARCTCNPGYVGSPASPEGCILEPCSQSPCGQNAECESKGRSAICRCPRAHTGDPYVSCRADPCGENPCGEHAICENSGSGFTCKCPPGYTGSGYDSCIFNPCAESPCGPNAECSVSGDRAVCKCVRGFVGSPESRSGCRADPCSVANSCGQNAECRNEADKRSGGSGSQRPVCYCLANHVGNPYETCHRGECVGNSDCSASQACQDFHCVEPCQTACGPGAECEVRDHVAICRCPKGFTGDPFKNCRRFTREEICAACGANTDCEVGEDDRPICKCKKNYIGNPLSGCRHECERDSECTDSQKCTDNRCVAVCDQDACGENANCLARTNRAQCTCPEDFLGDGHSRCYTECTKHTDCSETQACLKFKCIDPCHVPKQICGTGADCNVKTHKPICSCPKGYTGDPFVSCRQFTKEDLCQPNPCGANAQCQAGFGRDGEDKPVCTCPSGHRGDPLVSCNRGDCDSDRDCPTDKGCYNFRCEDPCSRDACGVSADCKARNHAALCTCPTGQVGDPLVACRPAREGATTKIIGTTTRRFRKSVEYLASLLY